MQRLRSRELEKPTDKSLDGDTAHIKLDSVEMDNGRSAGSERLVLVSLDALGLPGVLKDVGFSDRDARISVALAVARMIHPSSEREALRWLETNSATLELLRLDKGQAIKLDKLYRLSDLLVKHHRAIEDVLFARQRKLFGTGGAVIFYDLTNTHMTGRPASALVKFGRSKQKRNDCSWLLWLWPPMRVAFRADPVFCRAMSANPARFSTRWTALPRRMRVRTSPRSSWTPASPPRTISPSCVQTGLSLDHRQAGRGQAGSDRGYEDT